MRRRPHRNARSRSVRSRSARWRFAVSLLGLGAALPAFAADPPLPPPLASVAVPEPPDLAAYVRDRAGAIALGKALFWDMQIGSDGITACASCHFRAGADPRAMGQLNPGALRVDASGASLPDLRFDLDPLRRLAIGDFPLRVLSNPLDRASAPLRDSNDVVASQGLAYLLFATDRFGRERSEPAPDPDGFAVHGRNLRRAPPRNAASVINAVFNHRNFWDGRAQATFNGVNHWGDRDPAAQLFGARADGSLEVVRLRIENASLASQALAPLVSSTEMSAAGRTVPDVGRRVASLKPLALQRVDARDSALGGHVLPKTQRLAEPSYARWVKEVFEPRWWRASQLVQVTPDGDVRIVDRPDADDATREYTLVEWNFGLFFGLAVQLYEATLVSGDTPFDRWRAGDESAVSDAAKRGADVFRSQTRGRCINCHAGAELTDASVAAVIVSPIRIREGQALDRGYNNIGVRETLDDPGVGGFDAFGAPLADARRADPPPSEALAVDGAFKAPGLRNVELTAPYFHNGGTRTLEEVVEFYSRGGDFAALHARDGSEIAPLRVLSLDAGEKGDLVAFLRSLTDERVRRASAPFDHPQLLVPDGRHLRRDGRVGERFLEVPAVGQLGGAPLPGFLE